MIGTYAAVLAICGASLALGQAALVLCGVRRWSWLAPGVGLALLCALCWATVRLGGDGLVAAVAVPVAVIAAVACLRGRVEGGGEALRAGLPVALAALLAASLPFAVEGHFGILGTSFNPDMSQHLLAADRLAHGAEGELLRQGYPLGPHAVVVALNKGLGVGLVQGFSGLTVAAAVLAPLTALAAFARLRPAPRTAAALVVGLAYLVASYFAQGAFKETIQALLVLAFALALREAAGAWRDLTLRFVPAALIAVGSVYVYSFPGLLWLGAIAVLTLIFSAADGAGRGSSPAAREDEGPHPGTGPAAQGIGLALLTFLVLVAPEIGRMIDFHSFETFDPSGPGLGNLFGQVSPFEALGIWPSGDFRLAAGDGAVPAAAFYLGAAFALVLLVHGAWRCWQRGEDALLAALGAVALAYAAARLGGTPYTAAKALEIVAPVAALVILLPLLDRAERRAAPLAAGVFATAAGVCSLLALANAPVGPTSFSPALHEFRAQVGEGPTLVLAADELLGEQHGEPFLAWEMRGGRVCIEAASEAGARPPRGVRFVVSRGAPDAAPYPGLRVRRVADPYVLWEARPPTGAQSPCPLVAERQARQGPAR